jgi:hypothetical protein
MNYRLAFAARNARPGEPAPCTNVTTIIALSPIGIQSKWFKIRGAFGISTRLHRALLDPG